MAARQIKATRKAAPAGRNTPARTAVGKPKAVAVARKTPAGRAAAKPKAATSAPKPASMTAPLPPIVTLKHLAEWAGYNHGVPKQQAIDMLTGFVTDIGRALKKGSKIRIPNLGILQVGMRPARPARKGRNPATGEEIRIRAGRGLAPGRGRCSCHRYRSRRAVTCDL
jgi:DNA-binding protein HU-beta